MPRSSDRAANSAIEVEGLTKRYKKVVAVDDVSFQVATGGVFAFLGTNGAGKSTTIGCLTTVLPFDAGKLIVAGRDIRTDGEAIRRSIGVVFQDSVLDDALTARENLRIRARFSMTDASAINARIAELSALIELDECRASRSFTGG